jgi:hypothetical protein
MTLIPHLSAPVFKCVISAKDETCITSVTVRAQDAAAAAIKAVAKAKPLHLAPCTVVAREKKAGTLTWWSVARAVAGRFGDLVATPMEGVASSIDRVASHGPSAARKLGRFGGEAWALVLALVVLGYFTSPGWYLLAVLIGGTLGASSLYQRFAAA